MGVDLADVPLDAPVGELEQYNSRGFLTAHAKHAPDRTRTFGDLLAHRAANRIVGTPEQIADRLQDWAAAGCCSALSRGRPVARRRP